MAVITTTATPRLDLLGPILNDGFTRESFVADQVLPTFLVEKKAGSIPSFLFTDAQIINILHARGMSFARIQSTIDVKSFTCLESGLEEGLTPDDYDIITRDQAERQLSRKLVNIVLRQRDYAMASVLMGSVGSGTTFVGQTTTAVGAWNGSNGNPFTDIELAKLAVWQRIGVAADSMLIGYTQYTNLCRNPLVQVQIRNVLGYSGDRVDEAIMFEMDPRVISKVFGFKRVIVGRGTYSTANEGQTASYSDIWPSGYALVFKGYDQDGPINDEPGLGRMFVYDQAMQIGSLATGTMDTLKGLVIEMYREEQTESDIFRVKEFISQTLLVPTAGQLITSA